MRHNRARLLLMALFLTLASSALASTTWYVNGVSGSDSNNCLADASVEDPINSAFNSEHRGCERRRL